MSKITTALLAMTITFGAQAADTLGLKAGVFDPPRMAPDFTVRGSDGKELKLSQYRGKLVLLEFGYTSCVDVCPVSLGMLAEARRQMGAQASQLQVIYVTVDPERDTPERMRNYLRAFDPTFIGATGTPQQMARVRQDYGITATRKMIDGSKTDYTIGHSSYLYFVDRKGSLRALLPFGRTAADVVHDATLLLKN
ncbi:SCO family protein [Duganella vulcania]|uniref:Redoxin domain-containing protein n=1 Tax=Duganella vulcania TaxID=2692166 RepID=A0A845GSE7_9BURK|nr:SCO family protein [Duganella vulcania]MYM95597.1 redoxin domain-containing protein [Duganella vulcania]